MTNATVFNLEVDAGTTYQVTFNCKQADGITPMDLTGWTARMQVRTAYGAPGTPQFEFTSAGGDLVITPLLGKIVLTINPTDTDPITAPSTGRVFYYDLEIVNGAVVYKPFKGTFTLYPQITI
jgi:hypothetical protein